MTVITPTGASVRRNTGRTPTVVEATTLGTLETFFSSLGLDLPRLTELAGVDRKYDHGMMPFCELVRVLEVAANAAGMDDFALRFTQARGIPDFGPAMLLMREQRTFRDAIQGLIKFLPLRTNGIALRYEEQEVPLLNVELIGVAESDCRQATAVMVSGIVQGFRWLLGPQWSPAQVWFVHPRPSGAWEQFFRCTVRFSQEFNAIVFAPADPTRALPSSSPMLKAHAEKLIGQLQTDILVDFGQQAERLVSLLLRRGRANPAELASWLNVSRRTLHRRLADVGLNYTMLVTRARRNLVIRYIRGQDRHLTQVADLLGFKSLSAFSRWFSQAYRCTPRQWRQRHCGKSRSSDDDSQRGGMRLTG